MPKKPWLLEMESAGRWYVVDRFYNDGEANARMAVALKTGKTFRVRLTDGTLTDDEFRQTISDMNEDAITRAAK